jgi:hypothetical protein
MRCDEPRPVWTSLPITHYDDVIFYLFLQKQQLYSPLDFGVRSSCVREHPKGSESRSARCSWDRAGLGRGRPRYPYNAGSVGVMEGIGYPTCNWGEGFGV